MTAPENTATARNMPSLDDGVVRLRPMLVSDAADHLAGEDADLQRWLSGGRSTMDTVTRYLTECQAAWETGGPIKAFGITDAGSTTLAGVLEVQVRQPYLDVGQANLAYGLYTQWRGRGFATRAVELACRYLVQHELARQAVIRVQPENQPSAAVALRAGFSYLCHRTNASVPLDWYLRDIPDD